jgi:hypothetical protein
MLLYVYFVVTSTGYWFCLFFILLGVILGLVVRVCRHDYINNMRLYFQTHSSILFVIDDPGVFIG